MIFKQWLEVLQGQKTQTRRMADRYKVGSIQSVTPKMYKPAIWWRRNVDGSIASCDTAIEYRAMFNGSDYDDDNPTRIDRRDSLKHGGYQPLKVRIAAKRREPLQDITEADAIAEGVASVAEYAALWDSINKKKGTRWQDNPTVTVYTFELVDAFADFVARKVEAA